jgi:predicted DNA-binding transcriptional regulator AlpA
MWKNMVQRCYTPTVDSYSIYGGRGITVCPEWRDNPMAFVKWAEKQEGHATLSLDRIDSNGPYSPENCRFISMALQQRNRRSNLLLTYKDETKCLAEWCEVLGLKVGTVWSRLNRGRSVAEAFSDPVTPPAPRHDLTVDGRVMTAKQWAAKVGVSVSTIYDRQRKGQPLTAARGPQGPKPRNSEAG